MKKLKCPICGTAYTLSTYGFPERIESYRFECEECGYGFDRRESYEEAVSVAKKFISELPPIMRVKVGDTIEVLDLGIKSRRGKVRGVRVKHGVIAIEGSRRLFNTIDVWKWPWELKQEGGDEQ